MVVDKVDIARMTTANYADPPRRLASARRRVLLGGRRKSGTPAATQAANPMGGSNVKRAARANHRAVPAAGGLGCGLSCSSGGMIRVDIPNHRGVSTPCMGSSSVIYSCFAPLPVYGTPRDRCSAVAAPSWEFWSVIAIGHPSTPAWPPAARGGTRSVASAARARERRGSRPVLALRTLATGPASFFFSLPGGRANVYGRRCATFPTRPSRHSRRRSPCGI